MKKPKELLERIRNLPPKKKKIFFWTIIAVIFIFLFYFYIKDVEMRIRKFKEEYQKGEFNIPTPSFEKSETLNFPEEELENLNQQIEELNEQLKKQEENQNKKDNLENEGKQTK